jgi:hypothetical protein
MITFHFEYTVLSALELTMIGWFGAGGLEKADSSSSSVSGGGGGRGGPVPSIGGGGRGGASVSMQ